MSNIILISLPDEFVKRWRKGNAGLMLSQDVMDKYNVKFCEQLVEYYVFRRTTSDELEKTYLAPPLILRGKYNWNIFTSLSMVLLDVADAFLKDEIDFLKANKLSYYYSEDEHSNDKFGKSEETANIKKRYLETAQKPIGFDTSKCKEK